MARKKDNKEAMFEALSRGVGSSMKLPDWAKPSSPQPFEHPEMLEKPEKPEKRKEATKSEPPAVPEITIKLKAAVSGVARKFKGLKNKIEEKRLAAVERKLAAIEKAREEKLADEELLAEKLEAAAAEEQAAEESQPLADEEPPVETEVEEVEVIEAEIVEEVEEVRIRPLEPVEEYEEVVDEVFDKETEEDEEIEEIAEEEPSSAEEKIEDDDEAGLFASLQTDEETAEDEYEADAVEEAEETVEEQPQVSDEHEMPGEEAGEKIDDIKIKSVPADSQPESKQGPLPAEDRKKSQPVEVVPHVTATSIQQQVDLVEDNALLSQTLYARQVAMETSPEDSVHITLSRRAFLGILGGALGIIGLVLLFGHLLSKPAASPAPQQAATQQEQAQPQEPAQQQHENAAPQQETPAPVAHAAAETSDEDKPILTAEPGKRDPKRYYIVIQQLVSSSMKDREEAFNIVEFCKERGLPAEVVMIDGKKLAVWSLVGLKTTDDDTARKHAMMVEQLGKDYFKISRTYDFRQRMRDGRLRPYYIKGKPYATQNDGNKNK